MKSRDRPNIVLIIIDSLRPDHLSCYGYERRTTPFVDELSSRSVVFENAISPSGWTLPVFSSIFTGTYPSKNRHSLERFSTMMETLRPYGYRSFGISDNPFAAKVLRNGCDKFVLLRRQSILRMPWSVGTKSTLKLVHSALGQQSILNIESLASGFLQTELAKRWLVKDHIRNPFLLTIHYSTHWPYAPPEPFLSRFLDKRLKGQIKSMRRDWHEMVGRQDFYGKLDLIKGLYDGQIAWIDNCVHDLLDCLKTLDLYDGTLVAITADHGDLLGEHGLLHHELVLYDPLVRVPLIIRFPDLFENGKKYTGLVQTLDIFPTLIDYLGIERNDVSREMQGKSLLRLIANQDEREYTISERSDWASTEAMQKIAYLERKYPAFDWNRHAHEIIALRTTDHKYIWSSEGRHELYDLKHDPLEANNLISVDREKASELGIKLELWMRSFERGRPSGKEEFSDPSVEKRLRALGYI